MGRNLALNIASKGFKISVSNRSRDRTEKAVEKAQEEKLIENFEPHYDIESFVKSIRKPRAVIILVNAGKPVDDTIALLAKVMEPGDIIVDGGNEWYENTERRGKQLEGTGILYVGMGVSGGEEGARHGPSLMPGGPIEAYEVLKPILVKVAAQLKDGTACVTHIGTGGSGNYVKMVHNGIEYGDMQLIAEAYDLLKHVGGLTNRELAAVFGEWNQGELESYLIEITADIFKVPDEKGKGEAVDYVLDKTGMKGTGTWTVRDAAQQGVAIPTIAAALTARQLSGLLEERKRASAILPGPGGVSGSESESKLPLSPYLVNGQVDKAKLIKDVRDALYAAKVCSYAQGMALIRTTAEANGWQLNMGEIARIWKGGCIIRARFLDDITKAFKSDQNLKNLLTNDFFAQAMCDRQHALRRICVVTAITGIAAPSFTASLAYYDMYRRDRLPANLTQAQRDYFGAHTFKRIDDPTDQDYHLEWAALAKSAL